MIGTWQIIAILVIVVLLFGAKRIPDLAGSVAKGIREFKKVTNGEDEENKDVIDAKKSEDSDKK